MFFAVVYFPKIELPGFEALRQTYDPYAQLLPAHLPLVFPFSASIGLETVEDHLQRVLLSQAPINLHFKGIEKSWDHWMLWVVQEGRREVEALHDQLYTGPLTPFLRADLPYTPHIGLGLFTQEQYDALEPSVSLPVDEKKYLKALTAYEQEGLDIWCQMGHLSLLELDASLSSCTVLKEFKLST